MRYAIAALLGASLAACVQVGNTFDLKKVGELTPGVTTQQEAIEKLGKPSSVSGMPGGGRLLQWQYAFGTGIGVGGGAHAAILFDRDGIMSQVTHISSNGAAPDIPDLRQNDPGKVRLGVNGLENPAGMSVVLVAPASVAEKAGIKPGDIITSYNGKTVRTLSDVLAVNDTIRAGNAVPITVSRGGSAIDLTAQF